MDTSQGIAGPTGLGEKWFGSMALLVNAKRSASTAALRTASMRESSRCRAWLRRPYAPPPATRKNTSWPGGFDQIVYAVKDAAPQRVAELAAQFGCDILEPPVEAVTPAS
jgi:hypothetical protein